MASASHRALDEVLARVRRAQPSDNALLLELMAHVPMEGDEGALALSTRRDPDFFALYDVQRGSAATIVYDDGEMQGMGAALVRDGFLDGRAQPVGYLGDLRVRGTSRGRRAFPFAYNRFFAEVQRETGCESFVTAVLAANAIAHRSLAGRKKGREPQPYYHPLTRFEMASVQMVLPPALALRNARVPGVDVASATASDLGDISAFLAEDHARRPFGYRFDDGELEHRLARWPGFTLEDTLVARAGSAIVGVCTAWDPSPVKRYRVVRYAKEMRAIKVALDVAAPLLGCPRLPARGADFRSLYLTNLSARDAPALRALVARAYALAWKKRAHFFALPLYEGDVASAAALAGFIVQRVPFVLYAVTSSTHARTEWPAGRPGFEMALA